ncbi:MAG: hypothetical protein ACRCV0_07045 [Brevinema sp.]
MQKIEILKSMFGENLEKPQFDLQTFIDLLEMSCYAKYLLIISEVGKIYNSSEFCLGTDKLEVSKFDYKDFLVNEKYEWVGVKIPNYEKDTYFLFHYKTNEFYIYTRIDSVYVSNNYIKETFDNIPEFYWRSLAYINDIYISTVQFIAKEELAKLKTN